VPKLAFEIANRLNEATPITPTSLVALTLLSADDRSITATEARDLLIPYLDFVARRDLPTSEKLRLDEVDAVRVTLDELTSAGVVERFDGTDSYYRIRDSQHLALAYYRNTIIHFFVNRAITELALISVVNNRHDGPLRRAILNEALRIRDLLKFEFFFSATDPFEQEIRDELADHDADINEHLAADDPAAILASFPNFISNAILRPFFEAYRVAGDIIEERAFESGLGVETILPEAMQLGRDYLQKGLVAKQASVSKVLFESALSLADNRGLFTGKPTIVADRKNFAAELRGVITDLDALAALET
jgi:glycerol-3-phosphate O-acyltransferase